MAPVAAMKLCRLRRFVKGHILQDDEVLGVEARAQPCLQPSVEDHRIARALDEQRLAESPFHTGHNQRGPWPSMPGAHTVALSKWQSRIRRYGRAVCHGE